MYDTFSGDERDRRGQALRHHAGVDVIVELAAKISRPLLLEIDAHGAPHANRERRRQ